VFNKTFSRQPTAPTLTPPQGQLFCAIFTYIDQELHLFLSFSFRPTSCTAHLSRLTLIVQHMLLWACSMKVKTPEVMVDHWMANAATNKLNIITWTSWKT